MERIPLGLIPCGREVNIKDIVAVERVKCQLFEQGLVPGSQISVVKNDAGGPLVIAVKETRLALGRGVSMQIMVEENHSLKNFSPELVYTNYSGEGVLENKYAK